MANLYRLGRTLLSDRLDNNASYLFDKKKIIFHRQGIEHGHSSHIWSQ